MKSRPQFKKAFDAWEKKQNAFEEIKKLRKAGKFDDANRLQVEVFGIGSLLA